MSEAVTPSATEFIALVEQMDEPVRVAFVEAVQWLTQLPPDQVRPSEDEFEELVRSIVEKNAARKSGRIN